MIHDEGREWQNCEGATDADGDHQQGSRDDRRVRRGEAKARQARCHAGLSADYSLPFAEVFHRSHHRWIEDDNKHAHWEEKQSLWLRDPCFVAAGNTGFEGK